LNDTTYSTVAITATATTARTCDDGQITSRAKYPVRADCTTRTALPCRSVAVPPSTATALPRGYFQIMPGAKCRTDTDGPSLPAQAARQNVYYGSASATTIAGNEQKIVPSAERRRHADLTCSPTIDGFDRLTSGT
jgi:hypothetical protein